MLMLSNYMSHLNNTLKHTKFNVLNYRSLLSLNLNSEAIFQFSKFLENSLCTKLAKALEAENELTLTEQKDIDNITSKTSGNNFMTPS